ncbi:hypothetical protein OXX59_001155 [Metschnikowia pulcherrima]
MRFTLTAIIALAPLVAAKDVYEWIDEFSNITSTDSSAFSSWRQGYESAYKTWVASYFDEYGSLGYASAEIASIESSVFANADAEATQDYSYFYDAFNAIDTGYDLATETGDAYFTLDYSDFVTASDGYYFDSDYYDDLSLPSGFATQTGNSTVVFATPTASSGSNVTSGASASKTGSSSIAKSSSESSQKSENVSSAASTSSGSSGSSGSSSAGSSSAAGSSSSAMGGHQAPMLIGAALAGISVILL